MLYFMALGTGGEVFQETPSSHLAWKQRQCCVAPSALLAKEKGGSEKQPVCPISVHSGSDPSNLCKGDQLSLTLVCA